MLVLVFPGGSDGKEFACNAGDLGFIPGLGRSPVEGNGYPLQYSCLGNPMDRGICQATIHGLQRIEHGWVTFNFNDSFRHLWDLLISLIKEEIRETEEEGEIMLKKKKKSQEEKEKGEEERNSNETFNKI